jgi:hypothetical protein
VFGRHMWSCSFTGKLWIHIYWTMALISRALREWRRLVFDLNSSEPLSWFQVGSVVSCCCVVHLGTSAALHWY